MPSQLSINIKVPLYLKEYYEQYCNSIIFLEKKSQLLQLITSLLECNPVNTKASKFNEKNMVKIILPYLSHRGINIEYQNYINPNKHQYIINELDNIFKNRLHNFILGYIHGAKNRYPYNDYGLLTEGLKTFCEISNINFKHINFDSLKKSFQRSSEYKFFLKKVV
jgi:hypothetical protein